MPATKVPKNKERYNYNSYNFKIRKLPLPSEWQPYDAVMNLEQAKNVITSQFPGVCVIVDTRGKDPVYPYTIYRSEKKFKERLKEYNKEKRWK